MAAKHSNPQHPTQKTNESSPVTQENNSSPPQEICSTREPTDTPKTTTPPLEIAEYHPTESDVESIFSESDEDMLDEDYNPPLGLEGEDAQENLQYRDIATSDLVVLKSDLTPEESKLLEKNKTDAPISARIRRTRRTPNKNKIQKNAKSGN